MNKDEYYKKFIKKFDEFSPHLQAKEKWEYLISAMACALSNISESDNDRRNSREAEYQHAVSQLGGASIVAELLGIVIDALEEYPEEDFLGVVFSHLKFHRKEKGQHFTPSSVAELMAALTYQEPQEFPVTVYDPSCGSGTLLLAKAKIMRKRGINYQKSCLFVGQELDRMVAQMCYIQLVYSGMPGYVVVGDTINNPVVYGKDARHPIVKDGQEIFFTPMYWDKWQIAVNKYGKLL